MVCFLVGNKSVRIARCRVQEQVVADSSGGVDSHKIVAKKIARNFVHDVIQDLTIVNKSTFYTYAIY